MCGVAAGAALRANRDAAAFSRGRFEASNLTVFLV